ncbi:M48 family metalloprotease [Salipiger manganoxidans]|nr:M48 family metalloprotease [Salipiger manganoxidans]MCD1616499.1 M48 family metalloprotease [Salipiger manganoxidans]MEB3419011.1 M48 family metalloprotease [Salipiger manganoxidans]
MRLRHLLAAGLSLAFMSLTACGTTYSLPEVSEGSEAQARTMFAAEQSKTHRAKTSSQAAVARLERVASRVKPVASSFCQSQLGERADKSCDLPILIDRDMPVANAYHTRDAEDQPYVAVTVPMLLEIGSDDELAFILGHEYGHHIADHIEKGRQQALAGALILGAITAAGQAYATEANPYRYTGGDSAEMERNVNLGMALGHSAYSQSYELESDVIATHITRAAGYDPIEGAKFFARAAAAKTSAGNLSFWGTHPPDAVRLATVIEAEKAASAGQALARKAR